MMPGDAIYFRQTCRGGYGFQRDVPAVLVRLPDGVMRRAEIRVRLRDQSERRIYVALKNIRPRETV